ncbi:alpha/beta hydrolase [Maritimibacter sp. 55A14]|uniref:alpha/beta hydrolase n=1 Tax=Maritimibacter sp. 55A14 TaxID=2174844 RepID=UPI000D61A945|nr:alpha/beta hydrolase [Maritimibacter sp. 55A14]PWE34392.1 alpha/beta hydrolase [Maritimibacter sp. 55A14]
MSALRRVLKGALVALAALALAGVLLALYGPREPVARGPAFDPAVIGADIDAYLAGREARFTDITSGTEKHVLWAGEPGARTGWAVVYLHGFSATSQEIRPVPDRLAEGLGANLYFARLAGHGRGGAALAEARVAAWWRDAEEALAIGRRLGDRVLVLATSTGATLAALATTEPDLANKIDALVFVSPNFRVQNPAAALLTLPYARRWVPLIAGAERSFAAQNDAHARYWTTRYPTEALVPMAAMVAEARARDYSALALPAFFTFSDADQVVDPAAARLVAGRWGGPVTVAPRRMGMGDDPFAHVIAGDILSPGQTGPMVAEILDWVAGL